MEVNPWRSPIRPGGFCILYPYLSPVWYTSAWHRLSHSGLRRRVRVCARTPKPHSTHLLIHVRGKKWETATLSSVTAGNSPPSALCSLQWDWLLVSIILSPPPLHNRHFLTSTHKHTIPHNFTISLSLSLPSFIFPLLSPMSQRQSLMIWRPLVLLVRAIKVCSLNPAWKSWDCMEGSN